jgi:hypothetical protein
MRLGFQLIVAMVVAATVIVGGRAAAAAPTKTLVFEGTVTSIRAAEHELTPWLVTVAVRKVVSGEFDGSSFEFAVHSPARAGLKEGDSFTVRAVWKDGGYTVDEKQWRQPKRLQTRPSGVFAANSLHATEPPASARSKFAREGSGCPTSCPFVGSSVALPDRDLDDIFNLVASRSGGHLVRGIQSPAASDHVPTGAFVVSVVDKGDCGGGEGRNFFVAKRRGRWRVLRIQRDVGWGCVAQAPASRRCSDER